MGRYKPTHTSGRVYASSLVTIRKEGNNRGEGVIVMKGNEGNNRGSSSSSSTSGRVYASSLVTIRFLSIRRCACLSSARMKAQCSCSFDRSGT